ncbi:MAG TPA: aminotransferase class III-fold pyridoxal phosphate-dependent enzyme [Blastocatellia bacterium]
MSETRLSFNSRTNTNDRSLRERASKVIPGGMYGHQSTALLPAPFPQFFSRAEGARIWDADGNEYIDYMCAYGPNLLGYGHPTVEAATARQQANGDTMTGPSEVMVALAEKFVSLVTHADWAMFCKNGTDATSMALAVARAHLNRKKILVGARTYHGSALWCTPRLAGIVPEDRAHFVYYEYNNVESLRAAFELAGEDVAGLFVSAFRHEIFEDQAFPTVEFARESRALCDASGALLIVDDVRAGFRVTRDCTWSKLGVHPDLSAWGKVIANGYPISALLGSDVARDAASRIFVTGSFWFSAVPMAAAIATLDEIEKTDYLERTEETAKLLRDGLDEQAKSHGFKLKQTGPAQMPQIFFEDDPDFRLKYCWTEEALLRGVYFHPYHNMFVCSALTPDDVHITLEATDEAFQALKQRRSTLGPVEMISALLSQRSERR